MSSNNSQSWNPFTTISEFNKTVQQLGTKEHLVKDYKNASKKELIAKYNKNVELIKRLEDERKEKIEKFENMIESVVWVAATVTVVSRVGSIVTAIGVLTGIPFLEEDFSMLLSDSKISGTTQLKAIQDTARKQNEGLRELYEADGSKMKFKKKLKCPCSCHK